MLDELVAQTSETADKVSLLYRLGQLAEERLSAVDMAARAYEAIVALDPGHLPTLRALERLYEQAGRGAELFAILERQRGATAEGAARDRIVARMAEVASTQLRDDETAIGLWRELLARNPRADGALVGLEAALERLERWGELAEMLRSRLSTTVDPREITRLNDRLGWVLGVKLGQADEAARSFRVVLERDPKNRGALQALRDILQAKGDLEELAAVLRRLIPLQEDAAGVKAVRLHLAETLGRLGRREEAIEAARRALDLDPHRLEELERAEQIFRELSAWPECLRAMEARAELLAPEKPEEAEQIWMSVARLHDQSLHKPEGGAPALEKLLERNPGHLEAAEALEGVYARAADWRRLAALLDRLSRELTDPVRRLRVLRELAVVQEQRLGQKDLAFLALCRAFELEPGNAELADALRRIARETGAIEELAAVYESVAEQVGRGPGGEAVFLTLSAIQDEDLDEPESAEKTLRGWLTLEPASLLAVERLAALFQRRGRPRDQALALEQKVNLLVTLEEKKLALAELARTYDAGGDQAEAVLALRRGLELDPADRALIDQLAALYRREQAWQDLVSLLQKARDQVEDSPTRAALQAQIAEITEVGLRDDEAAISAWALALELESSNEAALVALERLYTKLDRAAELLRVYDRQAELAAPKDRVRIFSKAAQVWEEKLHNSANAIACLEGVLALEPTSTGALKELERLYRAGGDGERLAYTLQRRLQIASEPADIVALHVMLGEVWHKDLGRVDQAEALLSRALQLDPNSQAALHGLGELYEKSGNWPQALEMIRREARLAKSAAQAVELHFRAGQIHADMLLDPEQGRLEFERCLEIDQAHLPSLTALKRIFEGREEWPKYVELARREAELTQEPSEKTRLFYELGRLLEEKLEDALGAERCYVEALRCTPGHLLSAQPLAELYLGRSEWAKAEEMLDLVVEGSARSGDAKDLCRQSYRLGYVCEKVGKTDKALSAYRRAFELDATYLPALEGLGHILVKAKQPDEALKVFQAILIHHRDALTDLEVVEIYWQIGELRRELGQKERAQKDFEKALELDPSHQPSHQSLIELFEAASAWDQALEHRQRLLETLEGDARFEMCVGIARLSREHLGDPYQAIDAYQQALRVHPDRSDVLESLLAVYRETKQGQKAVEVLEKLLSLAAARGDPRVARDLHFALATILRDEIKDDERAIAELNAALDADPTFVEAFAAIEGLLTERRAWPQLEQSYHAMLKRLPKSVEGQAARLALWRNLGELYRRALKSPEGATMAYEVVVKAEPNDMQALEILAELYSAKPGQEAKAIAAHRAVLVGSAQPGTSVKTLTRLHASRKQYDEAYVSAQVAVHLLGERGHDEEQIVERLKRFARESASKPLTDRLWTEALYHERLRGPMAEVLAICHEATGGAFAVDIARLNVNVKRDRIDVAQSMLFFVNAYKYVARVLGMEALELFKAPGVTGLALGNSWPVCILAGEDVFKDRPKRELWFLIAKALAFSRPELALARIHPPDELDAIFQAALMLAVPTFSPSADPAGIERVGRRLEKALSDTARPALFRAARECVADPARRDMRGYLEAVEHTANRAGILLSGDIESAKRSLSRDVGVAARLPERSKVRDLLLFCMGESFFTLRKSVGLSVEVASEGRAAS
ncbi:MAG: tetratricopeptide repeat protein [Deltaproteobacteria bacterium]